MVKLKVSQEELEQIIYDYVTLRIGVHSIARKYKHSDKTIRLLLSENNIQLRNHSEACKSKYYIDENFFDINNQNYNMAYVMGFLAADGCISKNENMISLELKSIDIEVLEKINKVLKNERPIYISTRYDKIKPLETGKIYFFNAKMKNDLAKFNIIPNKTYDINFDYPNLLNSQFYSAYIRGYFDGDGSIHYTGPNVTWQIDTSSEKMANWFINYFNSLNIFLNHNYNQKTNTILHRCNTARKDYLIQIYNLLYKNPKESNPIYLERKYQFFTKIINEINSHETIHP